MSFFFPRILSRNQYALRWIALFVLVCLALFLYVAALINGAVYLVWIYSLWLYWIFGLAMPRLRSAGKLPWLALLCAVPLINIAMLVYLFAVRDEGVQR